MANGGSHRGWVLGLAICVIGVLLWYGLLRDKGAAQRDRDAFEQKDRERREASREQDERNRAIIREGGAPGKASAFPDSERPAAKPAGN